jgi:lincosamide nucleotidyltransferase A/C/D/E
MDAHEVLRVVQLLQGEGLRVWLDGGWGIDALLGEVTRAHSDVDLVIEAPVLARVIESLAPLGYAVAEDLSPVRVVLRAADGRQADLHPVTFADDGTGFQVGASPDGSDCLYPPDGFGEGHLFGTAVPCLSAELQVAHHGDYEPRERDRLDMALLTERFGLSPPGTY